MPSVYWWDFMGLCSETERTDECVFEQKGNFFSLCCRSISYIKLWVYWEGKARGSSARCTDRCVKCPCCGELPAPKTYLCVTCHSHSHHKGAENLHLPLTLRCCMLFWCPAPDDCSPLENELSSPLCSDGGNKTTSWASRWASTDPSIICVCLIHPTGTTLCSLRSQDLFHRDKVLKWKTAA